MVAGSASKKFSRLLMAEEEEIKHIAKELYHDLAQSLFMIKLDLRKAVQQIKNNQIDVGIERVESASAKIEEITTQTQKIGMHLCPPILDDLGILPAISWFCGEFQRTHSGIPVDTHIDVEEKDVPEFLKYVIYKILQEALNNIGQHSQASLVHLVLSKRNGTVELTIQHNGMEREDPAGSRLVFALDSIGERTELAGGSFAVESVMGKGTIIHTSWPV